MIYLFITVISLVMGIKIGSMYHILKITSIKNQINKESLEDTIKKQYDKKIIKYQRKIEELEEKLIDSTLDYIKEDLI